MKVPTVNYRGMNFSDHMPSVPLPTGADIDILQAHSESKSVGRRAADRYVQLQKEIEEEKNSKYCDKERIERCKKAQAELYKYYVIFYTPQGHLRQK